MRSTDGPQNTANVPFTGGGYSVSQGVMSLGRTSRTSHHAESAHNLHGLQPMQFTSPNLEQIIGSQCNNVSVSSHPFTVVDAAPMLPPLPKAVLVNHGMGLQQVRKGNDVAMTVEA